MLENTLDPAIRERGIAVTVLDPACGSGHLLLGAYDRLFEARRRVEPGLPAEESARAVLGQVFGVDLNPYAAAVARFRLVLSYLDKAGIPRLEQVAKPLDVRVYVGDSLLAGLGELQGTFGDVLARQGEAEAAGFERGALLSFFDPETDKLLAKTRFDVVVANPPYITEKDAKKRELIRSRYVAAAGQFALSAPFIQRIFQLGNDGAFTGQITANSFMKRDFGKRLIEDVLPNLDLTEVLDTSGAFIPGHGTPTVILLGRARRPQGASVRVVMGIRGEPAPPEVPAEGKVWTSIAGHHHDSVYGDDYISVADVERVKLASHPWSLGGGGAADLKGLLDDRAHARLSDIVELIGFGAVTREDDLFAIPLECATRWQLAPRYAVPYGSGDALRDWSFDHSMNIVFPYTASGTAPIEDLGIFRAIAWRYRTQLWERQGKGFKTKRSAGGEFYEYSMFYPDRYFAPFRIAFAFIATHNHFVLDCGGKVFKQSAPIIKLPADAAEGDYLALIGYLNSSSACFWMKQNSHDKGNRGEGGGTTSEEWERFFEFTGGNLGPMPLPNEARLPGAALATIARDLTELGSRWAAGQLSKHSLDALVDAHPDALAGAIAELAVSQSAVESRIRALQERLDWLVYASFGLCSHDLAVNDHATRMPAERVSDLLYARKVIEEQGSRRYFQLCRLPEPEAVASQPLSGLDQRRLEAIASSQWLKLLEQPAYKRTYRESFRPADVRDACESWLLTRAETALHTPRPLPIRALAHTLNADPKVRAVCEVLTGSTTYDLESLLGDLMAKGAVASAKCQRYTEAGLETHAAWERTWELQRLEDAGQKVTIEVPPKYDQKDFENAGSVWRLRGKLNVPKERFIAYPSATPPPGASGKAGLVFGWAGWDHLQQLQAAIELWQEELGLRSHELIPRATRREREEALGAAAAGDEGLRLDAAARERLHPILQTMADLLPWVRQWHDEDGATANDFEADVTEQALRLEVSLDEARAYRRPARTAGRARKSSAGEAKGAAQQGLLGIDGAAPARGGARGAGPSAEEVLAAVRELDGGAGAAVAELGAKLGVAAAGVKKAVDALVEAGRLVERKKRPRLVSAGSVEGGEG